MSCTFLLAPVLALPLVTAAQAPPPPAAAPAPAVAEETGETASRALLREGADEALLELMELYSTEETEAGETFAWTLRAHSEGEGYLRADLTFPSPLPSGDAENDVVHARYWRPKGEGPFPAVVVLHWLGGSFDALDLVCKLLTDDGVAALMIYMPYYGPRRPPGSRQRMLDPDNDVTLRNYRQAVLDIRRAGDWIAARPEVDGERVGLLGISLGSMVGSIVAGIEPRFDRKVLLIGGGDLPAIIFNDSRETRGARREAERRGLSVDELREQWVPIEPLTWAPYIAPDSVFMVLAEEDEIIPRECSLKLKEAIGMPDENLLWHGGGHYAIAGHIFWILPKAARWLRGEPHSR